MALTTPDDGEREMEREMERDGERESWLEMKDRQ